jgi:hypothetical protein
VAEGTPKPVVVTFSERRSWRSDDFSKIQLEKLEDESNEDDEEGSYEDDVIVDDEDEVAALSSSGRDQCDLPVDGRPVVIHSAHVAKPISISPVDEALTDPARKVMDMASSAAEDGRCVEISADLDGKDGESQAELTSDAIDDANTQILTSSGGRPVEAATNPKILTVDTQLANLSHSTVVFESKPNSSKSSSGRGVGSLTEDSTVAIIKSKLGEVQSASITSRLAGFKLSETDRVLPTVQTAPTTTEDPSKNEVALAEKCKELEDKLQR